MSERPIGLNLGMPASSAFDLATGGEAGAGQKKHEGDLEADARQLRQRLAGGDAAPAAQAAPKPFDLFGAGAVAPAPAAQPAAPRDASGLGDVLSRMTQRLLVDDGGNGRRAVQLQLSDDSLPGVVMEVSEGEGALVAVFTCSSESSRERLARAAGWLADQLAASQQRDVRLQVLADDPEDPCLVEVFASAATAAHLR